MIKYPKTPRFDGSNLSIKPNTKVTVQEKLDGSNVGISFDQDKLVLQSRSRILKGDDDEKHFDFFKKWAQENRQRLWSKLGNRYMIFAEYLYIKHRVYYDSLPGYFCALDVFDKEAKRFIDCKKFDFIVPGDLFFTPPVLYQGTYRKLGDINKLIGHSHFKSHKHEENLKIEASSKGVDYKSGTDMTNLMEGIYLRFEDGTRVKYPRPEFEKVRADNRNWMDNYITNKTKKFNLMNP